MDVAFGAVRFLGFLALLAIVGAAISLLYVLRGEAFGLREPAWGALGAAAVLLAVSSLMAIGLEGAKASGLGLSSAVKWSLITDVLDTRFGRISVVRALLAVALALVGLAALLWRERRERLLAWAAAALAIGAAITPALSGHARVDGVTAVFSDWAHVLAAGSWAGGLAVVLVALFRARERWAVAARIVPRFSALAVVSISVLLSAGVLSGFLEVRSWSGLWETTYGRLLLVKVGLVLPILALGVFNNRFSVPRLRTGLASALERRRFLTSVTVELALAVVIVGVTAALVAEPPARAQVAASGPVSRDTTVGPFDLNFVVDPGRTGRNRIHLYLLDSSTGQPAKVAEMLVFASLPAAGIGPLHFHAVPAGPGHGLVTGAALPLAGTWRFGVDVRRGEFDQWSTSLTIPIRKDSRQ